MRTATIGAVIVLLAGAGVAVLSQSPATNPAAFLLWEPAFPPAVRTLLLLLLPPVNLVKILSDAGVQGARESAAASEQAHAPNVGCAHTAVSHCPHYTTVRPSPRFRYPAARVARSQWQDHWC